MAAERISRNNWVTVRVWLPTRNGETEAAHYADDVGHVSLQTNEIYASFWPEKEIDNGPGAEEVGAIEAVFGYCDGAFMSSPELDEVYMAGKEVFPGEEGYSSGFKMRKNGRVRVYKKRPPHFCVTLFSLDKRKIVKEFKKFKEGALSKKWSLFGRNWCNVFNGGAGQSCSGLIYDLLNAGRVTERLGVEWDSISYYSFTTPDSVARFIKLALRKERKHHRSTARFAHPKGIVEEVPNIDLNLHRWRSGRLAHQLLGGEPSETGITENPYRVSPQRYTGEMPAHHSTVAPPPSSSRINRRQHNRSSAGATTTTTTTPSAQVAPISPSALFAEPQVLQDQLIAACEAGDLNTVKQKIERQGALLTFPGSNGVYPLGAAIWGLNTKVVNYLLAQIGADPHHVKCCVAANREYYGAMMPEFKPINSVTFADLARYCNGGKGGTVLFSDWLWVKDGCKPKALHVIARDRRNRNNIKITVRSGKVLTCSATAKVHKDSDKSGRYRFGPFCKRYKMCLNNKNAIVQKVRSILRAKNKTAGRARTTTTTTTARQ